MFFKSIISKLPEGSLVLIIVSIVNVALGFAREATIAYYFGTSSELDTFLAALAIPQMMAVNFTQVSVSVVLPLYIGYRLKKEYERGTALLQKWFWFSGAVIAVLSLILLFSAKVVIYFIAPGFNTMQRAEATRYLQMLLPFVWLVGMTGVFTAIQNSHKRFFVPRFSSQLVSLCVIVFCAVAAREIGATAILLGFLAGGAFGFTWQLLNSTIYEPKILSLSIIHKDIKIPISDGAAIVFATTALQIGVVVDRAFASELAAGSIAAFNYAQMVNSIPRTVLISSISTAIFPIMSTLIAEGNWKEAVRKTYRWTLFLIAGFLIPILFIVVFREEIISLVFKRGAFDESGVQMTAQVMSILPFTILASIASSLYSQLILSQKKARVLSVLAIITVVLKFFLNYLLVKEFGLMGLAMSTLLAATVIALIKVVYIHRGDFVLVNN